MVCGRDVDIIFHTDQSLVHRTLPHRSAAAEAGLLFCE
jgi:hypothetical protein